MKPVFQTRFGGPVSAEPGNCYAACIASVLELDLQDVPQVRAEDGSDWTRYYAEISAWLGSRGLMIIEFPHGEWVPPADLVWIAAGPSSTIDDCQHVVVYRGTQMIHDPNLNSSGLKGGKVVADILLVALDPLVGVRSPA